MSLYFDDEKIKSIYVGEQKVKNAYLGDVKIYASDDRLEKGTTLFARDAYKDMFGEHLELKDLKSDWSNLRNGIVIAIDNIMPLGNRNGDANAPITPETYETNVSQLDSLGIPSSLVSEKITMEPNNSNVILNVPKEQFDYYSQPGNGKAGWDTCIPLLQFRGNKGAYNMTVTEKATGTRQNWEVRYSKDINTAFGSTVEKVFTYYFDLSNWSIIIGSDYYGTKAYPVIYYSSSKYGYAGVMVDKITAY